MKVRTSRRLTLEKERHAVDSIYCKATIWKQQLLHLLGNARKEKKIPGHEQEEVGLNLKYTKMQAHTYCE